MEAETAEGKKGGRDGHVASSGFLPIEEETFSAVLRRFMQERGFSLTRLAGRSWLDISYVWRLVGEDSDLLNPRSGCRRPKHPSRDAVIRLGLALGLRIEEMDELLLAAGYAPLVR